MEEKHRWDFLQPWRHPVLLGLWWALQHRVNEQTFCCVHLAGGMWPNHAKQDLYVKKTIILIANYNIYHRALLMPPSGIIPPALATPFASMQSVSAPITPMSAGPEVIFSGKHNGICIYFARILGLVKPVIICHIFLGHSLNTQPLIQSFGCWCVLMLSLNCWVTCLPLLFSCWLWTEIFGMAALLSRKLSAKGIRLSVL